MKKFAIVFVFCALVQMLFSQYIDKPEEEYLLSGMPFAYVHHVSGSSTWYTGVYAFQQALDEANASAGSTDPVDSIRIYSPPTDPFVASEDFFTIKASNLVIYHDNSAYLSDGIVIDTGEVIRKVEIIGIHKSMLYINTTDGVGIDIPSTAVYITVQNADITASSCGISNLGRNCTFRNINIQNCSFAGLHNDAKNCYANNIKIQNCGWGILGHGSGNSLTAEKLLIKNCEWGCSFSADISVTIDRATIYNFSFCGIYNNSSPSCVHCKRCLVYNDSYTADNYCYYSVTFDDVWPSSTNDNVAMGGDCATGGHDFFHCSGVGTAARSYDGYPEISHCTGVLSEFRPGEANIILQETYNSDQWFSCLPMYTAAKALALYFNDPLTGNRSYVDNVGYDTDITKGIAKKYIAPQLPPSLELTAFPSPFNSGIAIRTSIDAYFYIFDSAGRLVATLNGKRAFWHPADNLGNGTYIIKALTPDGLSESKQVIYLK